MKLKKKKRVETEVSIEKKFFLAISDVADLLSPPPGLRKRKADKRPIRAKILYDESFPEPDQVVRSLAAKAYNIAQLMEKEGD